MLDLVVRGGLVVDGTGRDGVLVDVAVDDGRIVELAEPGFADRSRRTIDADGCVVAPGFVDIHTHLDAQVFWDPFCTPSSLHGVTSAIVGNCGFSIAPLEPDDGDYMLRLLAEVEAIPVDALEHGVPWSWRSFRDYLDAVADAQPAINVGAMVGHSALRRAALGDRHREPDPGPAAIAHMQHALADALAAGAFGFSSSWNSLHLDGEGEPVPSRFSSAAELLALCSVLADHPGSQVEFIPIVGPFEERHVELMIDMALAARAPLNWNVLIPYDRELVTSQLAASDRAASRGATVVALTYPGPTVVRSSVRSALFRSNATWASRLDRLSDSPADVIARELHDPYIRTELRAAAQSQGSRLAHVVGDLIVADTNDEAMSGYTGMRLADIAELRGGDAYDALFDLWAADGAQTGLLAEPLANSAESWEIRHETWSDPRVVIGASDAGAHVQVLSTFDYTVALLALARGSDVMTLPAAIRQLTEVPARLYGLEDRGKIAVGAAADLVVLDPETVGPGGPGWRDDLPAGRGRIYCEPTGISSVVVNGTETVNRHGLTGDRPGQLLRRAATA